MAIVSWLRTRSTPDTMCRSKKKLRPLYVKARERIAALRAAGTRITLVHVGRKWNADADAAANAAVDKLEVGVTRHSRGEPESPGVRARADSSSRPPDWTLY